MAATATAVATTAPAPHLPIEQATTADRSAVRRESAAKHIADVARHFIHRARAKLAFHDATRYSELVEQVLRLVPASDRPDAPGQLLRQLDRDGLGVWLLARSGPAVSLTDLCRRAIAAPGVGPPRALATLFESSLAGRSVRWFGAPADCELLGTTALMGAAIVAGLVATDLACAQDQPDWHSVQNRLTGTANGLQSAIRSLRRVHPGALGCAERSAALIFQAANITRRALNHTDLMSLDAKLAAEAVHLSLTAGQAASAAALECLTDSPDAESSGADPARNHLRSLARTMDAVLARLAQSFRRGSELDVRARTGEQFDHLLVDACAALASRRIVLAARTGADLCTRAEAVVQSAAELLDAWSVFLGRTADPNGGHRLGRGTEWVGELERSVAGECGSRDVLNWLRELARSGSCVGAAVCLSALRRRCRQLDREIWALIRARDSTPLLRIVAVQLFFRLRRLSPATTF